ncbi:hypothetical protein M758_UG170300 [Ceratodon purpureus]|nr:hypothetical protein M758_UG170300 [Ceratodon purpureus]
MQSGIILMTLSFVFGVSDAYLSALLTYLAGSLLLANNSLRRTAYELKTMIRRVGSNHKRIDCCPNGHILFEGELNKTLSERPQCGHPRYVPGSSSVPYALMRYFPIIPKMQRLYRCPEVASLLNHFEGHPEGSRFMRSVVDSFQWQEVSRM